MVVVVRGGGHFPRALVHNIILNACILYCTVAVVVVAVYVSMWQCSSWMLWLDSCCEQVYTWVLL